MGLHAKLRVEINPFGDSWVNETERVRAARWSRGRSNEFDTVNAARATVVFANADRRFDPEYTSGPYYGYLKPRVPIRIGFEWADGNSYRRGAATRVDTPYVYWRFHGFVDGWPQSYNGPRDATVEVSATDAFKRWSRSRLPSAWQQTIEAATKAVWYRQGESSGTAAADSSGNKLHGVFEGGATFNSRTGLVYGDADNAIEYNAGQRLVTPWYPTSYPFSVEMWIQVQPGEAARYLFRFANNKGTSTVTDDERIYAQITADSDTGYEGKLEFGVANDNSNFYRVYSTSAVDDGNLHHVVFTASAADALLIYVDGEDVTNVRDDVGTVTVPPFTGGVTTAIGNRNMTDDFPLLGVADEFVGYESALSAATVLAHYQAGTSPREGDSALARYDWLFDYLGWPEAWRDLDLSSVVLVPFEPDEALSHLQAVVESEGGRFFVDRDGRACLVGRQNVWSEDVYNASNATFGDGAGELGYRMLSGDLFDYDDSKIVNEARVRQRGGSEQVASDAGSQSDYGLMTRSESTLEARPGVVLNRAEYLVYKNADPSMRVPAITLKPERDPDAFYPILLAAELGYRYTVKRRPQGVGSAISKEVHLEGESWSATPGDITVEWELSPGEPVFAGWGVGLWGSTFRWAF